MTKTMAMAAGSSAASRARWIQLERWPRGDTESAEKTNTKTKTKAPDVGASAQTVTICSSLSSCSCPCDAGRPSKSQERTAHEQK